jgi:oxygen-dependent protoporphyrinogen oxidase
VSTGRDGDNRAIQLRDEELVDKLTDELRRVIDIPGSPIESRVNRWPHSFPQYRPGHVQWVGRINEELRRSHPRVMLCGASYRGIGIPACIGSGRDAAKRLLDKAEVPSG